MQQIHFISILSLLAAHFLLSPVTLHGEDESGGILKQGLFGAGVGAVAAGASGGDAGKGALLGAGTNVVGNLLFGSITGSSQKQQQAPAQRTQYYKQQPAQYERPPQRSYSQEEYRRGYEEGYRTGYRDAIKDSAGTNAY